MTTYLLITSDKPTELTAFLGPDRPLMYFETMETAKASRLPVVNPEEIGIAGYTQNADRYEWLWEDKGSVKVIQPDTPVELEGWEPEKVTQILRDNGWGDYQPGIPLLMHKLHRQAYRLKRSEPVKESPIEAKTQVFSHEEVKSMLRRMSLSEIHELEKKAHLIIDSHSDKELDEMTEHYFVAMGIKYAQVESHKTQESHEELFREVVEIFNAHHKLKGRPDYELLKKRFILTRRNP